jgi:PPK2 family polyphosphate:nucleotide phosphotransferase
VKNRPRLAHEFIVKPGSRLNLDRVDASLTHGHTEEEAAALMSADSDALSGLQERLWAEKRHAILVVLQGMDTSGKDGVIQHVFGALNPQGCRVTGFGVPNSVEAAHDYLWRVHRATPRLGEIGVFNRSHYESVLVVRVHGLVPRKQWQGRYDEINAFEQLLTSEGTTVLKFFLHIDRDEQRQRLQDRYQDPEERWKFNVADLEERRRWDDYTAAYEDALRRCSTDAAPWYLIPSNRKWFRNLAIGEIVAERIRALRPRFPKVELPPDLVIE